MGGALLFKNEYVEVVEDGQKVNLNVLVNGYAMNDFNADVMAEVPRLKVTKFTALGAALREGVKGFIEIGELLDVVQISIAQDAMSAEVSILLSDSAYEQYDKKTTACTSC